MTLKELFNIWLNKYVKHTIKLRTFITYQNIIDKHIIPLLGDYKLDEISSSIIQDFILLKIEKGNLINGNELAYNTVNSIVSVLKQALKCAYNLELISKDITSKITLPQPKEKKIEVFDVKEQQLLESFCLSRKANYLGIVLCLYTGLRIGELLALTWNDIDFDKKLLSVNKNVCTIKIDGKSTMYVDEPKTKSSIRVIPIPKQLIPYLRKIKRSSSSMYVITTKSNGMVGTRSYQKTYTRILNKLNLKYRNFHSLRHTFATRALELGMDVKSLSEILGHKNAMITLNRYSHSLLNYKIEMMNKLGKNMIQ